MTTTLYDSISNDDIKGVSALLKNGHNPNQLDDYGGTPLCRIVYNKTPLQKELLKLFIKAGANVNHQLPDGSTPLFHARGDIAKTLLDSGADINQKSKNGSTALHYATDAYTAKILVDAGLSINSQNNYLRTPLHDFIYFGSTLVKFAIGIGADSNATDEEGFTPLICLALTENANEEKSIDILKTAQLLLDAGAKINTTDNQNKTAYNYAIEVENFKLATLLLDKQNGT